MKKLLEFCLQWRVLVLAFVVLVALVGVRSVLALPIDAVPDITNVQVQVLTQVAHVEAHRHLFHQRAGLQPLVAQVLADVEQRLVGAERDAQAERRGMFELAVAADPSGSDLAPRRRQRPQLDAHAARRRARRHVERMQRDSSGHRRSPSLSS